MFSIIKNKFRQACKLAIKDPLTCWSYFKKSYSSSWIRRTLGSRKIYKGYITELEQSNFIEEIETKLVATFDGLQGETPRGQKYVAGAMAKRHAQHLYALVRHLKPSTIVETGVCNGFSTAVLLQACAKNGVGRVYSIDYPEFSGAKGKGKEMWAGKGGAVIPENKEIGWLIPEELKNRWTLQEGLSTDLLPPLLENLQEIDLFLHDSEHSFRNQYFEMETAYKHLSKSGLLICSDCNWSDAFDTFIAEKVKIPARSYYIDFSLAIIVPEGFSKNQS